MGQDKGLGDWAGLPLSIQSNGTPGVYLWDEKVTGLLSVICLNTQPMGPSKHAIELRGPFKGKKPGVDLPCAKNTLGLLNIKELEKTGETGPLVQG